MIEHVERLNRTRDPVVAFRAWFDLARPGAVMEYHRGYLVEDRLSRNAGDKTAQGVGRLAMATMALCDAGGIELVQRRYGDKDYGYLAVKRRRPA